MVFLEIPNVPKETVFTQVTFVVKKFRWIPQEMKIFYHEHFSHENIQWWIFPNCGIINISYLFSATIIWYIHVYVYCFYCFLRRLNFIHLFEVLRLEILCSEFWALQYVLLYCVDVLKVYNLIEEESIVLCNILYKCVLQSYYAIATVTFKVLSDHMV